jgi:hypothetical protein
MQTATTEIGIAHEWRYAKLWFNLLAAELDMLRCDETIWQSP